MTVREVKKLSKRPFEEMDEMRETKTRITVRKYKIKKKKMEMMIYIY